MTPADQKWPYGPNIISVREVINGAKTDMTGLPDGRWVPARSIGFQSWSYRIKAAWSGASGSPATPNGSIRTLRQGRRPSPMRDVIYAMEFAKCNKEGENAGRPRWCSCKQRGLTTAGCLDSDDVSEWAAALRAALVAMRERMTFDAGEIDAALAELDKEIKYNV